MDDATFAFIESCRRAVLATIAPDGRPRLVPICFMVADASPSPLLYTPLDEKPKRSDDVRRLARVRDIVARPEVTLLFDRWSEDWADLIWVRVHGHATILEPAGADAAEHRDAVTRLRARYTQYVTHAIEQAPMIRVALGATRLWRASGPA